MGDWFAGTRRGRATYRAPQSMTVSPVGRKDTLRCLPDGQVFGFCRFRAKARARLAVHSHALINPFTLSQSASHLAQTL